jgi:hypothetical protein
MSKILLILEKYCAALLILILGKTYRYTELNRFPHKPVIFAFWHRNIIPLLYFHRNKQIVIMISSSKDGALVAEPARLLGYISVRGSSTRGGSKALREMKKYASKHALAITPDGPRGPAQVIKPGLLYLAYTTKLPIVPVNVHISKEWQLKSWDRFRIPKPFARIELAYEKPIYISNKAEIKSKHEIVENKIIKQGEKL